MLVLKSHSYLTRFFTVLLIISVVSGCATITLKKFKKLQADEDYQTLAEKEIKCKKDKDGCNQLYLIKGDACFILAKKEGNSAKHYSSHLQCAIDNLSTGIKATGDWNDIKVGNLTSTQARNVFYENALEAARLRTTLPNNQSTIDRLASMAVEYRELEDSAASNYYVAQSELFKIRNSQSCDEWKSLQEKTRKLVTRFAEDNRFGGPIKGLNTAVNLATQSSCQ